MCALGSWSVTFRRNNRQCVKYSKDFVPPCVRRYVRLYALLIMRLGMTFYGASDSNFLWFRDSNSQLSSIMRPLLGKDMEYTLSLKHQREWLLQAAQSPRMLSSPPASAGENGTVLPKLPGYKSAATPPVAQSGVIIGSHCSPDHVLSLKCFLGCNFLTLFDHSFTHLLFVNRIYNSCTG